MSKGKKILKVVGIIFVSLIALIIILNIILNIVFGIQLRNKIAELKAKGRPMSIAEIVPSLVPDEENAALLYNKVFVLMGLPEIKNALAVIKDLKSYSNISQWTDEQRIGIPKLINSRDMQYVYELLEQGSKKSKCNFNPNYEDGPNVLLPHLNSMREAMRLLCIKAIVEAKSGNMEKAFDTLLIGLKISNHLKDEPLLISQLVRIACDGILVECIEGISNSRSIPIEKSKLIMDELTVHKDNEPFVKCMDGERIIFGMWTFERILRGKPQDLKEIIDMTSPSSVPLAVIGTFLVNPIFKKDFACYLTLITKAQDSLYYNKVKEGDELIPKYCIITNIFLPAVGRVQENIVRHQAYIDICRTGLALKIYKAKNGNYPEKLESLAPEFLEEVSVDPFSSEDLIYKKSANGFILYSVGPNMKDDGGIDARTVKWEGDYDIVWESMY